MALTKVKRALLSVSDKQNLAEFASILHTQGAELVCTESTGEHLRLANIPFVSVTQLSNEPPLLNGRVKTLRAHIHAAILADRSDPIHVRELASRGVKPFDLVVVNFYKCRLREGDAPTATDSIDIGGPTMARAAAKNHAFVGSVTSPSQYSAVTDCLKEHGGLSPQLRRRLATEAFECTAWYDAMVASWFRQSVPHESEFPPQRLALLSRIKTLRYGENPHQRAAMYSLVPSETPNEDFSFLRQHQGKAMSFNNFSDLYSAVRAAFLFEPATAVVVKHTNPCGLACADSITAAFHSAWAGDPMSAFGGIVALNRPCTPKIAQALVKVFVEVVVAPKFDETTLKVFSAKPRVRVLEVPSCGLKESREAWVRLGSLLMVQTTMNDRTLREGLKAALKFPTKVTPTEEQLQELLFAFRVVSLVKSNAIVVTKKHQLLGVGAGQMSRVDSVRLALRKAGARTSHAVLASDAFFPFADSVELAVAEGIEAFIQPGGSVRDREVVGACDKAGVAVVFTGKRCFRH